MSMKPYWVWSDGPLQLQRKTLDSLNEISGGSGGGTLVRLVGVPASSSAPGVVGDFAEDNDYLYVVVATNTWTRTPISDWS